MLGFYSLCLVLFLLLARLLRRPGQWLVCTGVLIAACVGHFLCMAPGAPAGGVAQGVDGGVA